MAQYNTGTVTVTNGSAVVTGTSTAWLTNINIGDGFTVASSGITYDVAAITSDTSITLSAPYAAATAANQYYTIIRDFTAVLGLPYPSQGDQETATIVKTALQKLDAGITVKSFNHRGEWLAVTAYAIADAVYGSGRYFVSKQTNNVGHIPPASPSTGDDWWGLVADNGGVYATQASASAASASAASASASGSKTQASASAASAASSATNAGASAASASTSAAETLASLVTALAANPQLDPQVRMNKSIVTADLSIPAGYNAYAAGPLEVAAGINITVGDNASLTIV